MFNGGDDSHHYRYVTNAHSVSPVTGYRQCSEFCLSCQRAAIFHDIRLSLFGERSAQPRHFLRIGLCLIFYSAIALLYIALFTSINMELALKNLLQKPVFYHLWFSSRLR